VENPLKTTDEPELAALVCGQPSGKPLETADEPRTGAAVVPGGVAWANPEGV